MSKPTVYLETSIIGYATSRPSRDLIVAARQQITREWFANAAPACEIFVSPVVIRESMSGDAHAADERLALLESVPLLEVTDAAGALAQTLMRAFALPRQSDEDALHIAVATVHGIEYLLTWNLKHIANATMRHVIERVCSDSGYEPPIICTPEELHHDDSL